MDIFGMLKEDHKKVSGIFEKLEPTTERAVKTREELFARLKIELDVHALVEEKILYPALEQIEETRDIALEAIEEHRIVKELLADMDNMSKESEQWTAKLTVLKENVEHHVEEEEGEMFKKARSVLNDELIEELTRRAQAEKTKQMAVAQR
ncbi:MAG TPA: hemerythrin domain-containing protein [Blastocatellia bacterium]|nr:hemerythrin domain-containing protein [Blastocatellia bacterium]